MEQIVVYAAAIGVVAAGLTYIWTAYGDQGLTTYFVYGGANRNHGNYTELVVDRGIDEVDTSAATESYRRVQASKQLDMKAERIALLEVNKDRKTPRKNKLDNLVGNRWENENKADNI